jgi:formimidoylglutamate deiminase
MQKLVDLARRFGSVMHIHVAEQLQEVNQCIERHNARPVEWLLKEFSPDQTWCLVHATHVDAQELALMSETGAVVCLCPSTEANLGDGIFPLKDWLELDGHIAIGSDSHITINPFEELRWLEYGQRLTTRSRNVAAIAGAHTGNGLFERALKGGAQAGGNGSGQLKPGAPADLITLDGNNPMLAGHDNESILDALVFCGLSLPIDRVMVRGQWQVVGGRHVAGDQVQEDFNRVARELLPALEAG